MGDQDMSAGHPAEASGESAGPGEPKRVGSPRSPSVRLAEVALAFIGYGLLYRPASLVFGDGAAILGVLPVVVAGWRLGALEGAISGLLCLPVNALLLVAVGRPASDSLVTSAILGVIALTIIGAVVGRLHDLSSQLHRELAQRQRSEAALRESERHYRAVVDTAIVGITIADPDDRLLYVNRAFADMLGHDSNQMIGSLLSEYMAQEEFAKVRQESHRRLQGFRGHYEVTMIRRDGSPCSVLVSAAPFRSEQGAYEGSLAVIIDITALKETQEALFDANERYRRVFDGVQDAIFVESPDGEILDVNLRACEMFGWPREEFLQKRVSDLIPEGGESVLPHLAPEEDLPNEPVETINLRASGGIFPVEITTRLQTLGDEPAVLVVLRDISARKQAEAELDRSRAELIRSNNDLAQFAYAISHDLQEPLRMVTSYLGLLEQRYSGRLDSDADEFIGFAVDGAVRMRRMIGGLLTFSRVGTRGKAFQATDLEDALGQVLTDLRVAIEESGAVVSHTPLPTLAADGAQMIQVFQNLISNAIKFSGGRRPEIEISAEREGGEWLISVRDKGIGIPADQLERVFDVLVRLHTRDEYPGEGMGLAICRRIIERHGGRIWAESEQGRGTVVRLALPDRGGSTGESASGGSGPKPAGDA